MPDATVEGSTGAGAVESMPQLIDEFFLARRPKKHSEHTLAAYRRDLDVIMVALEGILDRSGSEIFPSDLDVRTLRRAFAAISHQSAATISRTWSTWNQLFSFLVAEQTIPGNPMAAIEKPRVPRSRPKAITGDDSLHLLLRAAAGGGRTTRDPWPERDLAIVVVLITCGLRLAELLELSIRSLDGPPGERVIGVRGKGNKERTVPLEPEVEAVLREYLESRLRRFPGRLAADAKLFVDNKGRPMQRGALQYLVDRLYREAGIRSRVPAGALVHALRHTFATNLARSGASGTELQRLLGHESLATTQRYVDATAREIRAAARSNEAYRILERLDSPTETGHDASEPTEKVGRGAPWPADSR